MQSARAPQTNLLSVSEWKQASKQKLVTGDAAYGVGPGHTQLLAPPQERGGKSMKNLLGSLGGMRCSRMGNPQERVKFHSCSFPTMALGPTVLASTSSVTQTSAPDVPGVKSGQPRPQCFGDAKKTGAD